MNDNQFLTELTIECFALIFIGGKTRFDKKP